MHIRQMTIKSTSRANLSPLHSRLVSSRRSLQIKFGFAGIDPVLRECSTQVLHREGCSGFVL
jgi:hypothetical protein